MKNPIPADLMAALVDLPEPKQKLVIQALAAIVETAGRRGRRRSLVGRVPTPIQLHEPEGSTAA